MASFKAIATDKRILAAVVMAIGVSVAVSTFASGGTGQPAVLNANGTVDPSAGSVVTKPQSSNQQINKATELNGQPVASVTVEGQPTKAMADEVLVQVPNPSDAAKLGGRLQPTQVPGNYKVAVAPGTNLEQARQQAAALPGVKSASYNGLAAPAVVTPNDKLYAKEQPNLTQIKMPQAWDVTRGRPNVIVAVIDTGYNYQHQDLQDKVWIFEREIARNGIDDDGNGTIDDRNGMDFASAKLVGGKLANDADSATDLPFTGEYSYVSGHGSAVSSVIAAETNNAEGIAGINWNARVMPLRVCSPLCDWESLAQAIVYAANNGAKVVNMSLGGLTSNVPIVDAAIDYAHAKGVTLVAASGNDGTESQIAYPGRNPKVIAVGATGPTDERKGYSDGGTGLSVTAPAGVTTVFYRNDKYQRGVEGTSLSSPHVAGLASLIISLNRANQPNDVRELIEVSADKVPGMKGAEKTNLYGYGRINVSRALNWVNETPSKIVQLSPTFQTAKQKSKNKLESKKKAQGKKQQKKKNGKKN